MNHAFYFHSGEFARSRNTALPIFAGRTNVMIPFSVTILGSNSAIPTVERNPTAQLVSYSDKLFLLDCGEGTQVTLRRLKVHFQRISHIFISHLHGDHFYGLIGLVSSMHLLGREKELHIYGPPELKEVIDLQLKVSLTMLVYPLVFHPTQAERPELLYADQSLQVTSFPMKHRIPTTGFIFRELPGERHIRKDVIDLLRIPFDRIQGIKRGDDFTDKTGRIYLNREITLDPPANRVYVFCSDTAYNEEMVPLISGADLLYHETTFARNKADAAADKFHSTTTEAAAIAKKANVKRLIIGHFSARYTALEPLLEEVQEIFPETVIAAEGTVFDI